MSNYINLRGIIQNTGTQYLDIGSSIGGSIQRLEHLVQSATKTDKKVVLGVDVSDKKVYKCNRNSSKMRPRCVKADLRELFSSNRAHHGPIVKGTQMLDILEHINRRTAMQPPLWRRRGITRNGTHFDTASHEVAIELWKATCAASTDFCYMQGPSFDNELKLRKQGFMLYWQAWNVHTAHVNSTSLLNAMLYDKRAGTRIVLLLKRIDYSNHSNVLVTPPSGQQSCDGGYASKRLGCDRHNRFDERYRSSELGLPTLLHPNAVKLHGIYTRMWAVHAFHSTTAPLNPIVLKLVYDIYIRQDYKVIHCDTTGSPLVGEKCFNAFIR